MRCTNSLHGVPSSHGAVHLSVAPACTMTRAEVAPAASKISNVVSIARCKGDVMTMSADRRMSRNGPRPAARACSRPISVKGLSGRAPRAWSTLCPACACRTKASQRGAEGTIDGVAYSRGYLTFKSSGMVATFFNSTLKTFRTPGEGSQPSQALHATAAAGAALAVQPGVRPRARSLRTTRAVQSSNRLFGWPYKALRTLSGPPGICNLAPSLHSKTQAAASFPSPAAPSNGAGAGEGGDIS
mmetsp:Transcript_84304/g.243695  ORF Transcript_84304/g.243695 Transcript_84304/m.243695 type:complete len:243 (+) Transcript_84304:325-1053(+)